MANPSGSSESPGANKWSALGRLRRLLGWLILIVLLLYGASNLWLSSGWGTGLAEDKLKERTGLDWEVGSMTWSPWNGFTINDARMLQPEELRAELAEPVVLVDRIRVKPFVSKTSPFAKNAQLSVPSDISRQYTLSSFEPI